MIALLLSIVIFSGINGDPFLFFPEHLLPPIGTTYNYTFEGFVGTWKASGTYFVEPVTDSDMKIIVGYRNWQSYTGELTGIFYGISYKNGTYPQALVNPNTQECENAFSEKINCTNWSSTMNTRWDNECSIVRIDSPITGSMSLTLYTSSSDLKRPVNFSGTTTISGSPVNMTVTYSFLSKTEQKNFPYIKCSL